LEAESKEKLIELLISIASDSYAAEERIRLHLSFDGDQVPEGLTAVQIPPARWAVFTSVGPMPGAIQSLFVRIFQEWFPATGYEHADAPELEVYLPGDPGSEDYRCEIWIPIVKKDA